MRPAKAKRFVPLPFYARVRNQQRHFKIDKLLVNSLVAAVLQSTVVVLKKARTRRVKPTVIRELDLRGVVDIALVSDRKIKMLNRKWRKIDAATDVLSFPLGLEIPPPQGPFEVGDIVISLPHALKQARQYNHSVVRELAFLVTHGLLHVLGFDHETKRQEVEMFSLQRAVLAKAGIDRSNNSRNRRKRVSGAGKKARSGKKDAFREL